MAFRNFGNASLITGSKSSKLWDQVTFPGVFDSINTALIIGSSTSTVTFNNIPQYYKHLQLRTLAQQLSTGGYISMTFNSGSFVRRHWFVGSGSGTPPSSTDTTNAPGIFSTAVSQGANNYAASIIDIFDYTNSNKNITTRSLGGSDLNGSGSLYMMSSLYTGAAPISSITLTAVSQNFSANSHFALYGIRG